MMGRLIAAAAGVALLLFGAVPARASVITSPTGAAASSTFSADYDIGNTIDQSGLDVTFISGVSDFDAYLGGNPIHTPIAINNEWFTALGVTQATVTYDLGSAQFVDRLALWNEEFSGFGTGRISYSLDGVTFLSLISISPIDSPFNEAYGAQIFGWETVSARFFRFDVSGCPQPNGDPSPLCGIGEVAFSIVNGPPPPNVAEPGTLVLLGLGLAGAGWLARAKRSR
jgi:PEP-CTERM motif